MTPNWIKVAQSFLGLKEVKGDADNAAILEFYKLCGHPEVKHDETPWCAAFVGGVLSHCGIEGSRSLAARSYEHWEEDAGGPHLGAVVVLSRPGGEAWQGHVGFLVGANDGQVILLGGNQGDMVSYAAFARDRVVAMRWPPGLILPDPEELQASVKGAAENPGDR